MEIKELSVIEGIEEGRGTLILVELCSGELYALDPKDGAIYRAWEDLHEVSLEGAVIDDTFIKAFVSAFIKYARDNFEGIGL